MKKRSERIHGFTIPTDWHVEMIRPEQAVALCAACEGRPAFVRVRRPDDPEARPLCGQCAISEMAPPTPTPGPTEQLAHLLEQLRELEQTGRPLRFERMAEFAEEWWEQEHDTPLPAELSAIVARARASAPSPLEPVSGGDVGPGDLTAARLALFMTRGGLAEERALAGDLVVVEPREAALSSEAAAELLARMPKPLACRARAVHGVMTVRCRALADPADLASYREQRAALHEGGVVFSDLHARYGEGYPQLPIFCLGRHESMLVTVDDIERLERDYEVRASWSASSPGFYLPTNPQAARAAADAGAVLLVKCYHDAEERVPLAQGRVIELRDPENWDKPQVFLRTAALDVPCSACHECPAEWLAVDTRDEPWRERSLCARCVASELAPLAIAAADGFARWFTSLSAKGRSTADDRAATAIEHMEQWWKVLAPPPEVSAAIERCRQLRVREP